VAKRRTAVSQQSKARIEEGERYELEITGTGRKGGGVAERGKFTVFVSGSEEGQTVTAEIESVSGTLAFARRIN
jgi:translation initiation factor 2 subunit 2